VSNTIRNRSFARLLRCAAAPLLAVGLLGASVTAASASTAHVRSKADQVILLPGATSAESVAAGQGSTFYAGDLFSGDIFRGDIRKGTAELFIDAPEGRMAAGLKADLRHNLLFVAGLFTGQAYVYDLRTGATVASYQLAATGKIINDVTLTAKGAWITDSAEAKLFFIPVGRDGKPGAVRTLTVTGAASDTSQDINIAGIAATPNGRTLIVTQARTGLLYKVNTATGASTLIEGIVAPDVDGIVLDGQRLWAVQNFTNQISNYNLSRDLSTGTLNKVITSPAFAVPTGAALFGHRLAVANAHLDSGIPPTSPTYEVVVVNS
jgi:sugar lactone lactonase YvrE